MSKPKYRYLCLEILFISFALFEENDLKRGGSYFFVSSRLNSVPCNLHVEVEQTGIIEIMTATFEKCEPKFFLTFLMILELQIFKSLMSNCNCSLCELRPKYVL